MHENLRLWSRLAGTPRHEVPARIEAGLTWTGLAERARSRVETLSGGMRRRVNLLAGMLHRPSLLVLDEPTVGIDADARERIYTLLRELCAQGTGVLLATHELEEAGQHCDAVVVLDAGRVVASGSRADLLASHSGHAGEVVVVAPSADADGLRAEGFHPSSDGEWVGVAGTVDLGTLERRLAGRGIAVSEIRLRRPTLTGAVARVIAVHRENPS